MASFSRGNQPTPAGLPRAPTLEIDDRRSVGRGWFVSQRRDRELTLAGLEVNRAVCKISAVAHRAAREGKAVKRISSRERAQTWVVDYSAARARAIAWLGDRYLLAKPVNASESGWRKASRTLLHPVPVAVAPAERSS